MLKQVVFSVIIVVLSFFLIFSSFTTDSAEAALKGGDALPKITLPDLKGTKVTLPDDFKGKVLVIHFWASWCPYCVKEIRAIEALHKKYGEKDMVPFSINVGESREVIDKYLASLEFSYTILLDPDLRVAKQYGVTGVPMTLVADRNGVLMYKIFGEITGPGLKKILSSIIGQ
jgi:cytochrome c biogenesis protein CcmG, thiol:disulfide interchange protein DsbE